MQITTRSKRIIFVDESDAWLLSKYSYRIHKPIFAHTEYVILREKSLTRSYVGLLHNLILSSAQFVDHINGNGLDCRRSNLRDSTLSQNQANRRRSINLVKGVYWREDRKCWTARITFNNKIKVLGCFATHEQAVIARMNAEENVFGEFAGNGTEGR
jgi:hypothetical protein